MGISSDILITKTKTKTKMIVDFWFTETKYGYQGQRR